jgi:hypothetical protein
VGLLPLPGRLPHVFVGAGEGPCAVLMIGSRRPGELRFPVDEAAARHGASADRETGDPDEAYAEWNETAWERVPSPWPL